VANGMCGIEPVTDQVAGHAPMSGPGHGINAEADVRPGREPLQPTPLDQVITELTESKARLVVSEPCSGNRAAMTVGITVRLRSSVFQTEVDDPPEEEGKQIPVREQRRW